VERVMRPKRVIIRGTKRKPKRCRLSVGERGRMEGEWGSGSVQFDSGRNAGTDLYGQTTRDLGDHVHDVEETGANVEIVPAQTEVCL
jgi:hypothetical protein